MEISLEDDLLAKEPDEEEESEYAISFEEQLAMLNEDDQDDGSGSLRAAADKSSRPSSRQLITGPDMHDASSRPPSRVPRPTSRFNHPDDDLLDYEPDDDMLSGDLDDRDLYEEEEMREDTGTENKRRSDEENVSPTPLKNKLNDIFQDKLKKLDPIIPVRSKDNSDGSLEPQQDLRSRITSSLRGRGSTIKHQRGRGAAKILLRGRGTTNDPLRQRRIPNSNRFFGSNGNQRPPHQNYLQGQGVPPDYSQPQNINRSQSQPGVFTPPPPPGSIFSQARETSPQLNGTFPQNQHFGQSPRPPQPPNTHNGFLPPPQPGPMGPPQPGPMGPPHLQNMPPPGPVQHNPSIFGNNQQSRQNGAMYENRFERPLGAPPPLMNLDLTKPPPALVSPQAADYPPKADFVPLTRQIDNSFPHPPRPNDTNIFKIPAPATADSLGPSPGNGLLTSSGRGPIASARGGSSFAASSSSGQPQVLGASSIGLSSSSTSRGLGANPRFPQIRKRKGTSSSTPSAAPSDMDDDDVQEIASIPRKKKMLTERAAPQTSKRFPRQSPSQRSRPAELICLDEDIKPKIKDEPDIIEIEIPAKKEPEIIEIETPVKNEPEIIEVDLKPQIKCEAESPLSLNSPFHTMFSTGRSRRRGLTRDALQNALHNAFPSDGAQIPHPVSEVPFPVSARNIKREIAHLENPPSAPIGTVPLMFRPSGMSIGERFSMNSYQGDEDLEEELEVTRDIHEPGDLGGNAGARIERILKEHQEEIKDKPIPGPPPELMKGNISEHRFQLAMERFKSNTLPKRDLRHKLSRRFQQPSIQLGALNCPRCASLEDTCYKCRSNSSQPDPLLNANNASEGEGRHSRRMSTSSSEVAVNNISGPAFPEPTPSSSGQFGVMPPAVPTPSPSGQFGAMPPPEPTLSTGGQFGVMPPAEPTPSTSGQFGPPGAASPAGRLSSPINSPPEPPSIQPSPLISGGPRYIEMRNISEEVGENLMDSALDCGEVDSMRIRGTTAFLVFETGEGAAEFHRRFDGLQLPDPFDDNNTIKIECHLSFTSFQ